MTVKSKYLRPLVEEYHQDFVAKGYKPHDDRFAVLREFAEAWDSQRPLRFRSSLDRAFIEDWFTTEKAGIKPSSRAKYRGWLRLFIEWGLDRKQLADWGALRFDAGKVRSGRSRPPVWLDMEFVRNCWEAQPWYFRGLMAITTLTGARAGEIRTLRVGHLDMAERRIMINRWKVDKFDDRMAMLPGLFEELERYLIAYAYCYQPTVKPASWRAAIKILGEDAYLIPHYRKVWGQHDAVDPSRPRADLWEPVHKRLLAAMTPKQREQAYGIGTHTLRRSVADWLATQWGQTTDGMRGVQETLGHAKLSTTEAYLNRSGAQARRNELIDKLTAEALVDKITADAEAAPLRLVK